MDTPDRRHVAAGVVLLVLTGVLLGVITGLVPLGGDSDDGVDVPTPTAPETDAGGPGGDGGDGSDGSGGATTEPPPFEMVVESVEPCGETCRDVTATLVNNQDREATGVTVYTQIYAGDDAEGDTVWEGSQEVGTLDAGASVTDTQRVELGFMEAAAVQQNDGRITIRLTVETDRQTVSFIEHRDVS